MKQIINITTAALLGLASLLSCSDMNSLHEVYLKQGEKVYAAKIDSVKAFVGINEQELHIYTPKQRISSGVIRWNLGKDSLRFDIPTPVPTFLKVTIPNLEDGNYTYDIFCYDSYGNLSIGEEITSNVISQEEYEEKVKIAKTSFYYSEYDRLLASSGGGAPTGPEAKISNAQNFGGKAWFMWENDPLPGAKIIFRYLNLEGQEITRALDGNNCKKKAWCTDLSDALCTPASTIVFHYHTEYPGASVAEDIGTTIDLGEEYKEEIRYIEYKDRIEIISEGLIYPEIEDIW